MNQHQFNQLLARLTQAAESGNGKRFAECFTPDAIYHDYIYGPHQGRAAIADMLESLFLRDAGPDYRWEMFDGVINGVIGYAWSLSSFTSIIPEFQGRKVVIDGMSRFAVRNGLIADYRESVNGGLGMAQLGVEPERMSKVFQRWVGRLKDRGETQAYLASARGEHAKAMLLADSKPRQA